MSQGNPYQTPSPIDELPKQNMRVPFWFLLLWLTPYAAFAFAGYSHLQMYNLSLEQSSGNSAPIAPSVAVEIVRYSYYATNFTIAGGFLMILLLFIQRKFWPKKKAPEQLAQKNSFKRQVSWTWELSDYESSATTIRLVDANRSAANASRWANDQDQSECHDNKKAHRKGAKFYRNMYVVAPARPAVFDGTARLCFVMFA